MLPEFSAERVTLDVLDRLERRRTALLAEPALVTSEVDEALAAVDKAYHEAELPEGYLVALKKEVRAVVPEAWQAIARPFSEREAREFGVWRGGDVVARIVYVLLALMVGSLIVWAPFIPIWEKWLPMVMALGSWWLPDAQVAFQKRRYARALGGIARRMGQLQPSLEGMVSTEELLLTDKGEGRE